jgi:hypothetical protein
MIQCERELAKAMEPPAAVPSFADKPILGGELAKLRPVGPDDVPGLVELLYDPESMRLTLMAMLAEDRR